MGPAAGPALAIGLFFLAGISPGFAADLSLPAQIASPGASVLIPISFASQGEAISGLQFDLVVNNAAISLSPVIGDAARTSGKTLYVAALGAGPLRILVTELNQTPISDGALVNLFVNVAPAAAPGSYSIHLQSAVASDALGNPVFITTADASITVVSASGNSVSSAGVLNAASLLPGAIAPGEIITIFGSNLASSPDSRNTRVSFEGFHAPLLYTSSNQINAIVPFEISGPTATMEIAGPMGSRALVPLAVASSSPAIFTINGSGSGQGAILNQDSTVNSPDNPAGEGSIIVLFATGAGQTNPAGTDGLIATNILPAPRLPVSVQVGGLTAEILYAGAAPGAIAGVLQVNCRIPAKVAAGNLISVVLGVGAAVSPPVTVAVR